MNEILPKTLLFRKFGFLRDRGVVSTLLMSGAVVLVGAGAFGLGRLSALEGPGARPIIHAPQISSEIASPTPLSENNIPKGKSTVAPTHNFVGSKNGTKYYPVACAGASRIKAANQVWFGTAAEALAAGYSLASGCSGVQ